MLLDALFQETVQFSCSLLTPTQVSLPFFEWTGDNGMNQMLGRLISAIKICTSYLRYSWLSNLSKVQIWVKTDSSIFPLDNFQITELQFSATFMSFCHLILKLAKWIKVWLYSIFFRRVHSAHSLTELCAIPVGRLLLCITSLFKTLLNFKKRIKY